MRKEIGSEFWLGCTPEKGSGIIPHIPHDDNCIFTLSGRTALGIIVSDILSENPQVKSVYMPSYCCHTMIEPFSSAGIRVEFYTVRPGDDGFILDFDTDNDCDIVFLIDYFGYTSNVTDSILKNQKQKGKILVYDTTHSLLSQVDYNSYDYVFASFRKWANLNCGFCKKNQPWKICVSLSENSEYINLRNTAFSEKAKYINGEAVDKALFLEKFNLAEEMLETEYPLASPDDASVNLLENIDTDYMISKRVSNAKALTRGILSLESEIIKPFFKTVKEGDCPLFVPVFVSPEYRQKIRSFLISEGLYFPIHWPISSLHNTEGNNGILFHGELSIVCDQRYDTQHMEHIIKKISEALKLC